MTALLGLGEMALAWAVVMSLGTLMTTCWGFHPRTAVLAAPPATFGFFAVAGACGVPWRGPFILAAALAFAASGLATRLWTGAHGYTERPLSHLRLWRQDPPWLEVVALGSSMLLAAATLLWACGGSLDTVSQTWDAMFHVNAIQVASSSGQVQPTHLAQFVVPSGTASYYPSGFAAMAVAVMQLTGAAAVPASNVAAALLAGALWPGGLLLLTRQTAGPTPFVTILGALLSQSFWGFPWAPLGWGVLYPTAGAMAFLPLLVLGINLLLQRPDEPASGNRLHGTLLTAGATAMVALFHPRVFAIVAPLLALLVFAASARLASWHHRRGRASRFGLLSLLALAALPLVMGSLVAVMTPPTIKTSWPATETVRQAIDGYLLNGPNHTAPGIVVATLVLVGVVVSARRPRLAWVPLLYVTSAALDVITATTRDSPLMRLSWLWYVDRYRSAGAVPTFGVLLAVVGAVHVRDMALKARRSHRSASGRHRGAARRHPGAVPAAGACVLLCAAVPLATNLPAHVSYLNGYYAGASTDPRASLVAPHEVAFYHELTSIIAPEERILNNPHDGSALILAYAKRMPVFPTGFLAETASPGGNYLWRHLVTERNHQRICAMLGRENIAWVLNGGATFETPTTRPVLAPGMQIPHGFWLTTPVRSWGELHLYKVTGCDWSSKPEKSVPS